LYTGVPVYQGGCEYNLTVYASETFEEIYATNNPMIFSFVAVSIFVFTSLIFLIYDWWVEQRQRKVLLTAVQSSAIVSSLFPSNVRDRLFPTENVLSNKKKQGGSYQPIKNRLKSYMENDSTESVDRRKSSIVSSPIADLFTEATVLFADISGFTAWSSMREPTQVFTLLESVYCAFDNIADRRGVFKVETIGDSYVAVTGVPDPRKDHALVMTKFACDCRTSLAKVTEGLETSLGPDTGDLKVSINSV
jgi:Adenylate and Guanylate cyclase catalytic domain